MTDEAGILERAREAYRRRDWVTARSGFVRALGDAPLEADDLYALSNCAWWLGDLEEALRLQRQVHQAYLDGDDVGTAALVAIDIGYTLSLRGEHAQGSGWVGRAGRLLEDQPECAEHGYLLYLEFEAAFDASDLDASLGVAQRVHAHGRRFDDPTLLALGVLGQGRVLVRRGEMRAGLALLDEAMLAAVSDELDPAWAGNIYCHLMVACHEIGDIRRAGEWTEVTARWCESMPGAGPFMGICRVHRAQILQVRGAWDAAEREARHVCEELATIDVAIVAEAQYLLGELRRERGDLDAAEAAFREGHRLGRDPQPGLALLRLARGDADSAAASLRSALAAAEGDLPRRARLLAAAVEVALATRDVESARGWADELAVAASTYATTGFTAASLSALGAVQLAEGDAVGAVPTLRDAVREFQAIDASYDTARARLSLARAYEQLDDRDAAKLERQAAEAVFAELGIAEAGSEGPGRGHPPGGLTRRELEVLAMVAAGRSNQEIAAELVLSVRTIERHLATVYQKLGVQGRSARAAAVSFALREGILAAT
jgi:ATP/maltotriose-dependent transcriptional regulator MalT